MYRELNNNSLYPLAFSGFLKIVFIRPDLVRYLLG